MPHSTSIVNSAGDVVPVIDVSPFLAGDSAGMEAVAKEIAHACEHTGFFQIVGHGVDLDFIQSVYDVSRAFFDLSESDKAKVSQPSPDQVRGWSAVGKEGLSYSLGEEAPGDLKEKMDMGPPNVADEPYFSMEVAGPHFAPNVWPEHPEQFRSLWEQYFLTMSELSRQLMRMFAVGLDLPVDFFEDKIDKHISMFRALNYPDQVEEPLPGQLRAGAHSDYGSLTIVRQEDRPGGLEVLNKAGDWTPVPSIPGGLVVNIGDLMAEWTNDRWVSTLHRVVNPPRDAAHDSRRISLVLFHQPNYDALIECLPSCLPTDGVPKYAAITSGEHLYNKFTAQTSMGTDD
ncbi:MAG: 2-oxoglutarate and iron-dependent oxygenase domain-containing protein [Ilumatobacteraceae bacterium]